MYKTKHKIIIGSRKSPLAKKQVDIFKSFFKKHYIEENDIEFHCRFMSTTGDNSIKKELSEFGNKGLFTKEIDEAQLKKEIDISVHSLKDLPFKIPKGLKIGAYLTREDHRDAIITRQKSSILSLEKNSIIGTSSIRREAQMRKIRPDLTYKSIRGNVETRIRKIKEGLYDATFLAMAGIKRLNIIEGFHPLKVSDFVPAVGQGIIAVIVRENDLANIKIVNSVSDKNTELMARCERSFLRKIEGSCQVPVGAFAQKKKINGYEKVLFRYFFSNKDFTFSRKGEKIFNLSECEKKSAQLGEKLKSLI